MVSSQAAKDGPSLTALLDAVASLGADLELDATLRRIVSTACEVVGAKYGALGVLSADREWLARFITWGVTDEERDQIGPLPRGHGILGLLIREPQPLRLHDIGKDPRAHGFPAHHPEMHSFLGVPIQTRGRIFGNLYLAEKEGASDFTDSDEATAVALAAAAGVAIENARLYAQSERRQRWLEAAVEITDFTLRNTEPTNSLHLVVERARSLAESDIAAVYLASSGSLAVVARDERGADIGSGDGGDLLDAALAERVKAAGQPLRVPASDDSRAGDGRSAASPGMYVPLPSSGETVGVLAVATNDKERRYSSEELAVVGAFAQQAGLALERARLQDSIAELAVFQDRDRIARDLHDLVIQRLFATGLSLQGALRHEDHQTVANRISLAVDELDATIREIRTTIFELHTHEHIQETRARLDEIVRDSRNSLGYVPEWNVEGDPEQPISAEVAGHLAAVLREGLSNAARHAHAENVWARLTLGEVVTLEVFDDGLGIGDDPKESGLRNLRERATNLGGTFTVESLEGSGTALRWSVPANS